MPGPAPNPNARRRNNRHDWVHLPARTTTPPPRFPVKLDRRRASGKRLAELWAELWALPQATIWHQLHSHHLVYRYCLMVDQAHAAAFDTSFSAEARQLEDRLLLSPDKLLRARYLVDAPAPEDAEGTRGHRTVVPMDEYRDLYGG